MVLGLLVPFKDTGPITAACTCPCSDFRNDSLSYLVTYIAEKGDNILNSD